MNVHLLVLQHLLHNCLSNHTKNYNPNSQELCALQWFVCEANKGEFARLELLAQAYLVGIEPAELMAIKWLAKYILTDHDKSEPAAKEDR